jgi:hypothetical protein
MHKFRELEITPAMISDVRKYVEARTSASAEKTRAALIALNRILAEPEESGRAQQPQALSRHVPMRDLLAVQAATMDQPKQANRLRGKSTASATRPWTMCATCWHAANAARLLM